MFNEKTALSEMSYQNQHLEPLPQSNSSNLAELSGEADKVNNYVIGLGEFPAINSSGDAGAGANPFLALGSNPMVIVQSCLDMQSTNNLMRTSNELKEIVRHNYKLGNSIWIGKQDTITLDELRQRHGESRSNGKIKLDLSNSNISDAELQSIVVRFPNTIEINSDHCHALTDAGLAHLQGRSQLTSLNLGYTDITNAGLIHLQGLSHLTNLNLSNTEIGHEGLAHLRGFHQLTNLNLERTEISDEGLVHLQELSQLISLNLGSTVITDEGLLFLRELHQLTSLNLEGTEISDEGLAHLQARLINCTITGLDE